MINRQRLEELILARLSPATKVPPGVTDVKRSLFRFVSHALTDREWRTELDSALTRLRDLHHVEAKKLLLTAAGRDRLAKALQVNRTQQTRDWNEFKSKYLFRLIGEGLSFGPNDSDPSLVIVARKLGLPANSARSEAALANTWIASHLALRTRKVSLDAVRAVLLARELAVPQRAAVKEVVRLAACKLTRAKSAAKADIVQALASEWLEEDHLAVSQPEERERPAPAVTAEVIEKIQAAARSPRAKRFGDNKAFIASVWRCLSADPDLQPLGEAGFKRLLVEAHQRGDIALSRADLVAAMDPAEVRASETQYLNATYHFIQIGGDRP